MLNPKIKLKMLWFASSLLIGGLLLLLLASTEFPNQFWRSFLNSISTVLIVSSLWALVNRYLLQKEFDELYQSHTDKILKVISTVNIESKAGLYQILDSVDDFDCSLFIQKAQNMTILVDDLDPWLVKYYELLRERFQDRTKKTILLFYQPETRQEEQLKINRRVASLKSIVGKNTNLSLRTYGFLTHYKLYCTESDALLSPIFISKNTTRPIAFWFKKNNSRKCYYDKITSDIQTIISNSTEI